MIRLYILTLYFLFQIQGQSQDIIQISNQASICNYTHIAVASASRVEFEVIDQGYWVDNKEICIARANCQKASCFGTTDETFVKYIACKVDPNTNKCPDDIQVCIDDNDVRPMRTGEDTFKEIKTIFNSFISNN